MSSVREQFFTLFSEKQYSTPVQKDCQDILVTPKGILDQFQIEKTKNPLQYLYNQHDFDEVFVYTYYTNCSSVDLFFRPRYQKNSKSTLRIWFKWDSTRTYYTHYIIGWVTDNVFHIQSISKELSLDLLLYIHLITSTTDIAWHTIYVGELTKAKVLTEIPFYPILDAFHVLKLVIKADHDIIIPYVNLAQPKKLEIQFQDTQLNFVSNEDKRRCDEYEYTPETPVSSEELKQIMKKLHDGCIERQRNHVFTFQFTLTDEMIQQWLNVQVFEVKEVKEVKEKKHVEVVLPLEEKKIIVLPPVEYESLQYWVRKYDQNRAKQQQTWFASTPPSLKDLMNQYDSRQARYFSKLQIK